MKPVVTVSIAVEVEDETLLYKAALKQAKKNSLSKSDYDKMRKEDVHGPVGTDLIMLLDPGSLPGCSIVQSEIESE